MNQPDSKSRILQALQRGLALEQKAEAEASEGVSDLWPRVYTSETGSDETIQRFATMLEKVGGVAQVVADESGIKRALEDLLQERKVSTVLLSQDQEIISLGISQIIEAGGARVLSTATAGLSEQESAAMGITTAQAGIADTGTVLLWHTPERGRLAGLLPPVHIVLLKKKRLYPDKITFLTEAKASGVVLTKTPMTWVTGPSLTADIEKVLVRGAHGPREVIVMLY